MYFHIVLICLISALLSLDNGVSYTPPMGWTSWEHFKCQTDCTKYPDDCIGEQLIKTTIDAMYNLDLQKHGYQYINIGDCWTAGSRDGNNAIQPDNYRFPNGLKNLADYAHNKSFKLGILTSTSSKTCSGFVGSEGHYEQDANTFASWGIDLVKVDACNTPVPQLNNSYTEISKALNQTNRPILYQCSWGAYDNSVDFGYVSKVCNTYRLYQDVTHTWESMANIINTMGNNYPRYSIYTDHYQWFDPDNVIIGSDDGVLTLEEYKTIFGLWSIWSSPLILSLDFRKISKDLLTIITNDDIININQDSDAISGRLFFKDNNYEIWGKPLNNSDWAIAIFNHNNNYFELDFDIHYLGIKIYKLAQLYDLYSHTVIGTIKPGELYHVSPIPPHGTILIRLTNPK